MIKCSKTQLRDLIVDNITTDELNSKYDYSQVTDMSYMLAGCTSLTTIPELDTSNATNMNYMLSGCTSLTTIPELDTSNATTKHMLAGCTSLAL